MLWAVGGLPFPGVKQPQLLLENQKSDITKTVWSQSWAGANQLLIRPSRSSGDTPRTCTEDQLPKQTDQGFLEAQRRDGGMQRPSRWVGWEETAGKGSRNMRL